jgi:tetratricopeptide (TPR) repeat protein
LNANKQGDRPVWARRIEEERRLRGWSFNKAASQLRQRDPRMPETATISKYWAQRWETGLRKPGDRYRPHLCVLLGLPHEIFDDGYTGASAVHYLHFGAAPTFTRETSLMGEELIMMAARESADYGRRHGRSNVHPANLEQLRADVRELAIDFVSVRPVPAVLRARILRDQAFDLLDGRQWPQDTRDLYSLAGQLCGLLAVASGDFFGRYDAAATQCRTAWLCAEMADNDELRSWVRALQSGVAFWAGRWAEAAALAHNAREHARTAPSAMRAAALEARALAKLNDSDGVRRAAAQSEAARELLASDNAVGAMGFSESNRLRCIGTAYLWLGDHAAAQRLLEEALASYEDDDPDAYAHLTATRMDLASARLSSGDVDGAAKVLRPVLTTVPERRLAGAARRMSGLRTLLASVEYRDLQAATDLAAELAQFKIDIATLPAD